ncbi:MAG: F0F1 ATP synthase subunit B [Lachnospiraceae bacterium]|jgi:F-type H+-transporting ATPase subunit b|nr:F0F1 ATP synthase subunit B [Lachnospiraceae bacterium]MCI6330486.1 F0F1 ATP synthase subunit B [Lachnospiraceae bacterium]MCI6409777.1 F0F1 ATP synthase subunit B [Lachnospiraceae bacterium]MCI6665814.1 F0F1 ATP synthase subunit B [Lachnospiraceae bacterium]MCI6977251.1 F0F1 ATP synthase subunit B [Lachnospiraceae bacterium]
MERLFDLDLQLLADATLTAISVFVLFLLASYLLFNPARELLKKRQDKIKDDIDTANKDKEDAAALKADYDAKIKDIQKESEEILSEARKKAKANEAQIIAEAKEEANRIIKNAENEALLEKQRAYDEMKQEMISIASLMAGKVVAQSIDTTIQESLIEETLKEVGDKTWQS